MPRPAKTPWQKRNDIVSATVNYYRKLTGFDDRESMRKVLGFKSVKTVTARNKCPEDYTLGDLWRIQASMHIPAEEFTKFFIPLGK
jgi:hypothetical protein